MADDLQEETFVDMSESTNSDGLSVSDWRSFRVGHSVYLLGSLGIRSLGGDPGNRCFTRTSLRLKQDFYYGVVLVRFHAQEKKQMFVLLSGRLPENLSTRKT